MESVGNHPIENIMSSTLDGVRGMIDVDTIIGMPIEAKNGAMIIPFSKVSFGFVTGGGEYTTAKEKEQIQGAYPFAGGTGAGVTVQPIGFLTVHGEEIKLIPVQPANPYERLVEALPSLVCEVKEALSRCKDKQKQEEE